MKDDQKLAGVLNDPVLSKLWTWLKRKFDLFITHVFFILFCQVIFAGKIIVYFTIVCLNSINKETLNIL